MERKPILVSRTRAYRCFCLVIPSTRGKEDIVRYLPLGLYICGTTEQSPKKRKEMVLATVRLRPVMLETEAVCVPASSTH